MGPRTRMAVVAAAMTVAALTLAPRAAADHTDPNDQVAPIQGGVEGVEGEGGMALGEGEWEHLRTLRPHEASDVTFFHQGGKLYAAQGTLGQGVAGSLYVGQRIVQLLDAGGELDIEWRADHGSAACQEPATSATGLQHDSFATPPDDPEILTDTTDAVGRCHDTPGGGIELIDISGLDDPDFEPREIHLIRFNATTHTTTRYDARPWLIFSNNSDFTGRNWLDFADIRTCLTESAGGTLPDDATLDDKRDLCRPAVHRIPFDDVWTQGTLDDESEPSGTPAMCHDTVIEGHTLYCSGLSSEVVLDLRGLVDDQGDVRGEPLDCGDPTPGTSTDALVTDCALGGPTAGTDDATQAWENQGSPQAQGWALLGFYNHPGRGDQLGGTGGNTNTIVPADEGVAISHESRPTPEAVAGDRRLLVVSDERGGAVVPGGASCTDDTFDRFGHGGLHFLDVTDPANISYAKTLNDDGEEVRAIWRGDIVVPNGTFCVVHRFRHLPDEQRIVMGYYSQGMKILDYTLDAEGRLEFDEVASFTLPNTNSWTTDVFHTVDNDDGTRTYYMASSDTLGSPGRGMDILTWTHTPHPIRAIDRDLTINRLEGETRIETAVEVSKARFDSAATVILTRQDDYADALAGVPLADAHDGPILLTRRRIVPEPTAGEIERLGADRVILLGREEAIGPEVEAALAAEGRTVERIGGENRFETAALIAAELGDSHESAVLTEGDHADPRRGWPDAVSAAPFAAFTNRPVLLTVHGRLPAETAEALEDLGVTETLVIGGPAAVSDAVVDELRDGDRGPERVFGETRYETSLAVHERALDAGMDASTLWLATGRDFPDALTAGPAVAVDGDALLLVDTRTLDNSPGPRDRIGELRGLTTVVNLLGGTEALSATVASEVRDLLTPVAGGRQTSTTANRPRHAPLSADAGLLLGSLALLPLAAVIGRHRRPAGTGPGRRRGRPGRASRRR